MKRLTAGLVVALFLASNTVVAAEPETLRVLVAGAHPGDPEVGCGGSILRYGAAGHDVTVLYLTRGEAGIKGVSAESAAQTRSDEGQRACRLLGAQPVFAGQTDGNTTIDTAAYDRVRELIKTANPDVIFTHWPIDTHRDHRVCGMLVYDAWLKLGRRQPLYFYEVSPGGQTQAFRPTDYVDISDVAAKKREAAMIHVSQRLDTIYDSEEAPTEIFRGKESAVDRAEAFVRNIPGPSGRLP